MQPRMERTFSTSALDRINVMTATGPVRGSAVVLLFVGYVTDDLPASIGLLAEDIHPGLGRLGKSFQSARTHPEGPREPYDCNVVGDQDLLDREGICIVLGAVSERPMQ